MANDDQGGSLGPPRASAFYSTANETFLAVSVLAIILLARLRGRGSLSPGGGPLDFARDRQAPALRRLSVPLLLGSPVLWGAALVIFRRDPFSGLSLFFWEASVLALVLSALLRAAPFPLAAAQRLDLLAIAALSFVARAVWLSTVPARSHPEELWFGMWTRYCIEGRVSVFGMAFYNIPLLASSVKGLVMGAAGGGLFGLRLASAMVGTAAVVLSYLVAALLFPGRCLPAIAALFVACEHVVLVYGRLGMANIDGVLAVVTVVYLTLRSSSGGGAPHALLAGAASGLFLQGYFSARVAPVLALLLFGAALVRPERPRRETVRSIGAFLFALLIALGPMLVVYARDPDFLTAREKGVSAFSLSDILGFDRASLHRLAENAAVTVWLHTVGWDRDAHYGGERAFVPLLVLPLLGFGCLSLLLRPASPEGRSVLLWIALSLGVGSLLMKEPLLRRTVVVAPAFGLALAAGARDLGRLLRRERAVEAAALGLVLVAGGLDVRFLLHTYPLKNPPALADATGVYLASHKREVTQLLTLPDLRVDDPFVAVQADQRMVREIALPSDLAPGTVLVSVVHASALRAMARWPGVSVQWPWGRAPDWDRIDAALPSASDTALVPPAVVHLPALPDPSAWEFEIGLVGRSGRELWRQRSPLPCFDFRRDLYPRAAKVIVTARVDSAPGGKARILAARRVAGVTLLFDGHPVSDGQALDFHGGPHAIEATFNPQLSRDSYQLELVPAP